MPLRTVRRSDQRFAAFNNRKLPGLTAKLAHKIETDMGMWKLAYLLRHLGSSEIFQYPVHEPSSGSFSHLLFNTLQCLSLARSHLDQHRVDAREPPDRAR